MIKKEGKKWVLYTKDGSKKLGEFDSEAAAKKRERQIQYFKHHKAEVELVITKASLQEDGTMRWCATVSDTERDRAGERTSLSLFQDWIERVEKSQGVDFLPPPRVPFLGVSHYPSFDGEGEAGVTEKMYIDGKQFKVSGQFLDTSLGKALFDAVRNELDTVKKGGAVEQPIRISAAWWDLEHSHGNFVFTRRSLTEACPMCEQGSTDKVYLKGQPDHWASTRVPINPRTALELEEKSMAKTKRRDDAASIVGEEQADELEAKAQELVGKSETEEEPALVIKADEDDPSVAIVEKAVETRGENVRVRVRSKGDFQQDSFRTIDIDKAKGIKAVIGRPKGRNKTEVQSFLFNKEKWTESKASAWVKEHEKKSKAEVEKAMGEAMGDEHGYMPLGGAMSLAAADSFIETQQMMDRLYTNWDMYRIVVNNILSGPDGTDKVAAIGAVTQEFGDRVGTLKANVTDAFLVAQAMVSAATLTETATAQPANAQVEKGELTVTEEIETTEQPEAQPVANDPASVLGTSVQTVLADPSLSREARLEAIQEALNTYAGAVKAQLDAVAPPMPGEEIVSAIEKSMGSLGEKLDLLIAKLDNRQPAQPSAVPQQKSYAPTGPVQPQTTELPVSPITGEPSKLRAMIERSVYGHN